MSPPLCCPLLHSWISSPSELLHSTCADLWLDVSPYFAFLSVYFIVHRFFFFHEQTHKQY